MTKSRSIQAAPPASLVASSSPLSSSMSTLRHEAARESAASEDGSQEEVDIIRKETKALVMLKITAVFLLIVAALIVSSLTYVSFFENEKQVYQEQFDKYASSIVEQFLEDLGLKFWSCYLLSIAYTAEFEANATITTPFPYVTLPRFQLRAYGSTTVARSSVIAFSPIVNDAERDAWERYAVENAHLVVGKEEQRYVKHVAPPHHRSTRTIANGIYQLDSDGRPVNDAGPGPYVPFWQIHPPTNAAIMYNQMSDAIRARALATMFDKRIPILTDVLYPDSTQTRGALYFPVLDSFTKNAVVVGTTSVEFQWERAFRGSEQPAPITCILENSNGQQYTYQIMDETVVYLGKGDLHNSGFDEMVVGSTSNEFMQFYAQDFMGETTNSSNIFTDDDDSNRRRLQQQQDDVNVYKIRLYPTDEFRNVYMTNQPVIYSVITAMIFVFTSAVFIIYECLARRRQGVVMDTLARSSAIVHSLFPASVRDRMLNDAEQQIKAKRKDGLIRQRSKFLMTRGETSTRRLLGSVLKREPYSRMEEPEQDEPIAEFFPQVTVMFADIAGFTAWSSDREPSEVFQLLEALWGTFDAIAKRLDVFKIETVGDCYVCVTGLPDPNKLHAVSMTRFAHECLTQTKELIQKLEVSLGPGTTDLALRFGLHSGSVTAGVLRGEKARFQLFGDTMNTAARMESTGQKNRIHISQATAALLIEAGKEHWFVPRDTLVTAKGKGKMQTYWIKQSRMATEGNGGGLQGTSSMMNAVERFVTKTNMPTEYEIQKSGGKVEAIGRWISKTTGALDGGIDSPLSGSKNSRLVDWNVDVLLGLLGRIVKKRATTIPIYTGGCILEEVDGAKAGGGKGETDSERGRKFRLRIDEKVKLELHDFVTRVASWYRDDPFHNFEHASHVTMTANNLMKRILDSGKARKSTYGISSDPLAHFAVVFSALIHDVDHKVFADGQVDKERNGVADSGPTEKSSVELSWEMLMEPRYKHLRSCIYADAYERDRFRQFLINCVQATDITDMELRAMRKKRWHAAFRASSPSSQTPEEVNSRKATIVIELVMQTSSAAHYAQHWLVYRKWNERLFTELYQAYKKGRSDRDPSMGWFENEILFFDNHVIPLSKMIKVCGVFAGSNDECLTYALQNRKEWEMKGREICREMLSKMVDMEKVERRLSY